MNSVAAHKRKRKPRPIDWYKLGEIAAKVFSGLATLASIVDRHWPK